MKIKEVLEQYYSVQKTDGIQLNKEFLLEFFSEEENRFKHIIGVLSETHEIAQHFSEIKQELLEAAYLHDIGYSHKLAQTGFHPLDSGLFAAGSEVSEQVLKMILFHTGAIGEASLISDNLADLYKELLKLLTAEDKDLIDLFSFCDIHTSPVGEPVSIEYRVTEILSRYPAGNVVHENIKAMTPYFLSIREKAMQRLNAKIEGLPWVFLDVDNTLITPGGKVGDRTKTAIQRYIEAGGKISLVTGKIPVSIGTTISELNIGHLPHIGGNGAIIQHDGQHQQLSALGPLSDDIMKLIHDLKIPYCLYEADRIFYQTNMVKAEHIDYLLSINEPEPVYQIGLNGSKAIKLLMFVDVEDEQTRLLVQEKIKPWETQLNLVQTSPKLLEIMHKQQHKGNAIKALAKQHGHYYRYSVAAGDSENDLAMLNTVGMPYIVGNASPSLKQLGFKSIPSCQDEGVAHLLEKILDAGGIPNES